MGLIVGRCVSTEEAAYPAEMIRVLVLSTFGELSQISAIIGQLAVAVGGTLPLINEKNTLKQWYGGAPAPGPLTGYRIKGI